MHALLTQRMRIGVGGSQNHLQNHFPLPGAMHWANISAHRSHRLDQNQKTNSVCWPYFRDFLVNLPKQLKLNIFPEVDFKINASISLI